MQVMGVGIEAKASAMRTQRTLTEEFRHSREATSLPGFGTGCPLLFALKLVLLEYCD